MFAQTKLQVINLALMKVGLPLAAAIEDCDWNAGAVYDQCVRHVLREFNWGFATKYAVLPKSNALPPHGYKYAYQLPDDCVRLTDARESFDVRAPKARFHVVGSEVFTNVEPCNVRYVWFNSEPSAWPPDFTDAVAAAIAFQIAALSAQTMSMTPGLLQLYQLSLGQAQAVDASETVDRVKIENSAFLSARSGG